MAYTTTVIPSQLGSTLVTNIDTDTTESEGVFSGQTKSLYIVEIDNSNNTHISYVKVAKDAAITVGTSDPHFVFPVPALAKICYTIGAGIPIPALSFWAVKEAGVTGATAPDKAVTVKLLLT